MKKTSPATLAARLLRAIPSEKRSRQSAINGRNGGCPPSGFVTARQVPSRVRAYVRTLPEGCSPGEYKRLLASALLVRKAAFLRMKRDHLHGQDNAWRYLRQVKGFQPWMLVWLLAEPRLF